jgi:hypothetical protein
MKAGKTGGSHFLPSHDVMALLAFRTRAKYFNSRRAKTSHNSGSVPQEAKFVSAS